MKRKITNREWGLGFLTDASSPKLTQNLLQRQRLAINTGVADLEVATEIEKVNPYEPILRFLSYKFEDQYDPRKLGNWEYPKWYPDRPRQRFKSTKIISDDCGRLLEGIKRGNAWGNYVGTWDLPRRITRDYIEKLVAPPEKSKLWEKKKKVTEQSEIKSQKSLEKQDECSEGSQEEDKAESLPTIDPNSNSSQRSFQKRNKSSSALDLRPRSTKLEPLVSLQRKKDNLHAIKPGSLDEKIKNILDSVQEKEDKPFEPPEFICREIKAFPRRTRRKEEVIEEPKSEAKKNYEFLNYLDEHRNKFETVTTEVEEEKPEIDFTRFEKPEEDKENMEKSVKTPENKPLEPVKNGYSGFQIAKRFHDENLRHKPLPDVIDDPVFKALNSAKQTNEGETLNINSGPSAIGWKPYTAPRPTECSKLKVFRPKTGAEKQKVQKESRPKTGDSLYKKRFLPIDLAICWDLKPDDPSDEPKRSPHIDGSNGSVAPAVFTMIRPSELEETDQSIQGSSQAVVERITKGIDEDNAVTLPSQLNGKPRSPMVTNKEAILSCVRSSGDDSQKRTGGTPESLNSISPNAAEYARRHPKTAWTREDTSKALSDRLQYLQNEKNGLKKNCFSRSPSDASQLSKKKHHQSTPNLGGVCDGSHCGTEKSSPGSASVHSKNAVSDENKFAMLPEEKDSSEKILKSEQKKRNCSACKKLNSNCNENREKTEFKSAFKAGVPRSESTNSGSSSAAKSYKVPKMRLPYAKRSYSIGTLAPPFSLWRERNGQEYPEHWRLASVYQHSYKPINFRKRPLLASVYQ